MNKLISSGLVFLALLSPYVDASDLMGSEPLETVTVSLPSGGITIGVGESKIIKLPDWRYVQKIVVQAQGASSSDGTVEVYVNGDAKGTIYVPGRDPSYIVTTTELTDSLLFRHTSGGAVLVQDLKIVRVKLGHSENGSLGPYDRSNAAKLMTWMMNLAPEFERHSTYEDYVKHVLPIKKTAGYAYAVITARGVASKKSIVAMEQVIALINLADKDYFPRASSQDSLFPLIRQTLEIREYLVRMLE